MSVVFVICERAGGLTPERLERYEATRERIATLVGGDVVSLHYDAVESPIAKALVLSGSTDPWAMHEPRSLDRFYEDLDAHAHRGSGTSSRMIARWSRGLSSSAGST